MIKIENISYRYAGTKKDVFSNLNLQFGENKIYGLLGKNGTGKSTLLYLISGLLRRDSGVITVDGTDMFKNRDKVLGEIFIVPEEFELMPVTLDAYVRMNSRFYPDFSKDTLEKCLADFELSYDIDLRNLSMGQKKKVYMSFALATNTRLLLMDEPTNGLDIPSKSQFRKVMASNMSDDRTVIISTHQVHDIESLLDHVVIIDGSEVLLDATTGDICDDFMFALEPTSVSGEGVLYAEPSLQGNNVIRRRGEGDDETPLNLELLFNAVTKREIAIK